MTAITSFFFMVAKRGTSSQRPSMSSCWKLVLSKVGRLSLCLLKG